MRLRLGYGLMSRKDKGGDAARAAMAMAVLKQAFCGSTNEAEKEILKAVPVRRRSAARLAAVQITYQSLIIGQSALISYINFWPIMLMMWLNHSKSNIWMKRI